MSRKGEKKRFKFRRRLTIRFGLLTASKLPFFMSTCYDWPSSTTVSPSVGYWPTHRTRPKQQDWPGTGGGTSPERNLSAPYNRLWGFVCDEAPAARNNTLFMASSSVTSLRQHVSVTYQQQWREDGEAVQLSITRENHDAINPSTWASKLKNDFQNHFDVFALM